MMGADDVLHVEKEIIQYLQYIMIM